MYYLQVEEEVGNVLPAGGSSGRECITCRWK